MDHTHEGFYASQDADQTLDDDGDYYTWTEEEAAAVLPADELEAVRKAYRLEGPGQMHHDPRRHVLFVDKDPDVVGALIERPAPVVRDVLARAKQRLLDARGLRPAPFVDPNVYAGWNGMMISAFLEAARGLGRRDARDAALRALDRIVRDAFRSREGEGWRGFRHLVNAPGGVSGLLDDQVQMARALLDAFEVTGDPRYLRLTEETMAYVLDEFVSPWGGFYDVARSTAAEAQRPAGLGMPYIPVQDAPTPAGNAVAVLVLDRLAVITGEARYRDAAERALRASAPGNAGHGLFAATLFLALDLHLDPPVHVVVVGPRDDPHVEALHQAALGTYRPGAVVQVHDPSEAGAPLPPLIPTSGGDRAPRAFVCSATACGPPASTPEALRETIRAFGRIPVG
jgi:uncharacterized protein YyaL (SSP411 family)